VHPLHAVIPGATSFSTIVEVLDRILLDIGQFVPSLFRLFVGVFSGCNELFVLGDIVPVGAVDRDMPSHEAVVDIAVEIRLRPSLSWYQYRGVLISELEWTYVLLYPFVLESPHAVNL